MVFSARARALAAAAVAGIVAADTSKIHRHLLAEFESAPVANVMVEFKGEVAEVLNAPKLEAASVASRAERAELVRSTLVKHAEAVQAGAIELIASSTKLESTGAVTPFWISNQIFIANAPKDLVDQLAKLPEVKAVRREAMGRLITSEISTEFVAANTTEWGLDKIQAPQVWAKGYKGQGVVVGSIDTGARGTHEALKGNFRAENGWFQPEGRSQTPVDNNGHGTHTIGTSVGINGVGVAPAAKWISCEGCLPSGKCPESVLVACAQFMLCPHDANGKNPRCDLAPHVINNSW
ncbi:serine protease family S08A, partial [Achlya hypogyna]